MAVYEVVLKATQSGEDMLNVFHYSVPDGQTPDWQAGADELRAHIANYLAPMCDNKVVWQGIDVRLDSLGQVSAPYTFTAGDVVGTNGSNTQVRQLAMLVRKISQGGVRPVLGWFFQGGLSSSATTEDGGWQATFAADMRLYAEDIRILGAVATNDVGMVIKARNPTAPNTQAYSTVDAMEVAAATPRTVRSRMIGHGA